MKIEPKNKSNLLKSYKRDIPILILCYSIIIFICFFLINPTIEHIFNINQETLNSLSWAISLLLTSFLVHLQISYLFKNHSKTKIEITKESLILEGKNRSKMVNKIILLSEIDEIRLGGFYTELETFTARRFGIHKRAFDSRLNIFTKSGQIYQLDSASNFFEKNSLNESLLLLEEKGVKVHIYKHKYNIKIMFYWACVWGFFIYYWFSNQ